ncbi:TlpA family protein disulfide reductase [Pedobacter miscanthi]|uniref:Thioredoxin domain-containing protein n=1 Tax=Pedobacter miscanthi TaxID=2259170 RepID=A0A366KKH5_9SPHI|nr:TlpA disulfide reductase family protein [Pedobacter miscanthi]RBQ02197.1 hypothetical protein DRW42_27975 [Pedobacter miscanthi]
MKIYDKYLPLFFLCWAFLYSPFAVLPVFPQGVNKGEVVDLTARGVAVGEKVPDLLIENLHGYVGGDGKAVSSVKLSSFRGKLVILDFWATWCGACVGMMPVIDSLQQVFDGKVQFISVTDEPEKVAVPFLRKLNPSGSVVPFVTADKVLKAAFPHRLLPHYVWIDGDGVVVAITALEQVSGRQIKKVLMGSAAGIRQKRDLAVAYDPNKPMFLDGNGGNGKGLLFHSMLTRWGDGLQMGSWVNPALGKASVKNLGVKEMYAAAFSERVIIGKHRMVFDMKDPGLIRYSHDTRDNQESEDWMRKNMFCYELILPQGQGAMLRSHMVGDLRRLFPWVSADTVSMETMCTVLVSTGDNSAMRAKGSARSIDIDNMGIAVKAMGIVSLTSRLDMIYLQEHPYPVVDGSGITFPVDFQLDCDLSSVPSINKALEKYNLKLVDKRFKTLMLVFKDVPVSDMGSRSK